MVEILSAIDDCASVINSADEEGWVPLHSAASIGHSDIVGILLRRGRIQTFRLTFIFVFIIPNVKCGVIYSRARNSDTNWESIKWLKLVE